jgi:hypothetical protein
VSSDERQTEKDKQTDSVAAEHQSGGDKKQESSAPVKEEFHSGLSSVFHRPVADNNEDSLARRAEAIESQYTQFQKNKKLAVSGVTGAVGDLLAVKPEERRSALEDEIIKSSKTDGGEAQTRAGDGAADEKTGGSRKIDE